MTAWRLATSWLLAWRTVTARPWRAVLLCSGFGVGVGVMIVLLAVGEAMVRQASQERLVGGGAITVLPEGIDLEVLTTGGLGGLFFSVPNARFVHRQVLASPRLRDAVQVAAPQLEGKLLYLTTADGVQHAVRATGEVPSATRALGALPEVVRGTWDDDAGDHRWMAPTVAELRHETDHFHLPTSGMANASSWGEWHYFNVLSADASAWAFITFLVAGDPRTTQWGGQVLITVHTRGRPPRRFVSTVAREQVRFSTRDADVVIGESSVRIDSSGRYLVQAVAREEGTGAPLALTVAITPTPRVEFPGATLVSGDFTSGYAVPALRAEADGTMCIASRCSRYAGAQAYHDHNWGGWRGVTWEWGAARAGEYTVLYGRVTPEDSAGSTAPLFVYLTDARGFLSLFRPRMIRYDDARTIQTSAGALRVPASAVLADVRGGDTLQLTLTMDDAVATDTRMALAERGEGDAARGLRRPWFVQMAGEAQITGRIRGATISGRGRGFFETYR